ncbi:MAG: DUF389 domain-containing protein [Thermodesulfobacteriota bacterium]|nr:DUF389 domain-containing protein [Thermodesulfobacteriota bacterium]
MTKEKRQSKLDKLQEKGRAFAAKGTQEAKESYARSKEAVVDGVSELLSISDRRKKSIADDIVQGSTPHTSYYILMSVSALIASFGLVANSPAVVIGAMLVSPLMTPIFGVSLALVRGDMSLLRKALQAEVGGVALAIGVATFFGLLPLSLEVTSEMLARTSPTLLDLLVAALAGLAGCLAMIDERISPVLPGIAISISLLPPLSTCGLCLAVGASQGAYGAFLLFFANFLAILMVASGIFIVSGFVTREQIGPKWIFLKRFSAAVVALLLVTVLLTQALITITKERRISKEIEAVFEKELSSIPATSVEQIIHRTGKEKIDILATLRTPKVFSPDKVKRIEDKLNERIDLDTNLIVRCGIARDVSSTGSTSAVVTKNLDGEFITSRLDPVVETVQMAEQALREMLAGHPELFLENVDLVELAAGQVILASIQSSRALISHEVEAFERRIQERLDNHDIRLLVRCNDLVDVTSKGHVLYGKAHFGKLSPSELTLQKRIEKTTKAQIEGGANMFATNIDAALKDGQWSVRAEVVGPTMMTPKEVRQIEREVSRIVRHQVNIYVWCRSELMVTKEAYSSVEDFTKQMIEQKNK